MSRFAACFLLLLGQLAVGGFVGLAVPPFRVIGRGFYKSSAGVFLGAALLFLGGKVTLALRADAIGPGDFAEIGCWLAFIATAAVYLATLWGDDGRRRARAYTLTLALGLLALAASAVRYRLGPLLSPTTLLYPAAFLAGALSLGAVATGMLLGHWYLIDLGLSIEPLRRLFHYFVWVLVVQLAVLALTPLALALASGPGAAAVAALLAEHGRLLALRIVLGPLAALALGWMIHRTLQIPQTMAATGLFYIAILAVLVGEMLGRLILFRTAVPL